MDDTTSAGISAGPRRPNARGQGERLREEIISAAVQMLGDLAHDEALSLRAVARAVSISPTSVYLYFQIVTRSLRRPCNAAMRRWSRLRMRPRPHIRTPLSPCAHGSWPRQPGCMSIPGLYKVMHES